MMGGVDGPQVEQWVGPWCSGGCTPQTPPQVSADHSLGGGEPLKPA